MNKTSSAHKRPGAVIAAKTVAIITALAITIASVGNADAKRRKNRHRSAVTTALIIYALAEDDCPLRLQGVKLTNAIRDGKRIACIYKTRQAK